MKEGGLRVKGNSHAGESTTEKAAAPVMNRVQNAVVPSVKVRQQAAMLRAVAAQK